MADKGYQSIFDHEYFFHGEHANRLVALTSQIGSDLSMKLFQRNIDVFMQAPIIGFLYNRRAEVDNKQPDRTINFAQMTYYKSDLVFNYRLIMLLDKDYETDPSNRLDKAFRYIGTDKAVADEKRFEEYMRGGIDVLFEKLIEPSGHNYEKNLMLFLDDFNDRYVTVASDTDIVDLAKQY